LISARGDSTERRPEIDKRGIWEESNMHRSRFVQVGVAVTGLLLGVAAGGCGSDDSNGDSDADSTAATTAAAADSSAPAAGGLPNACPVDGCSVTIVSANTAGDEVELEFDANYTPDFERNHIHVFWDSQEAGAVSSDFQSRGFTEQGKWHPTDEYPVYVTQADASVLSEFRGDSTTLCVTAADTDHAVLDPTIVDCMDVAELLE
jgi:hypothetical protein